MLFQPLADSAAARCNAGKKGQSEKGWKGECQWLGRLVLRVRVDEVGQSGRRSIMPLIVQTILIQLIWSGDYAAGSSARTEPWYRF